MDSIKTKKVKYILQLLSHDGESLTSLSTRVIEAEAKKGSALTNDEVKGIVDSLIGRGK